MHVIHPETRLADSKLEDDDAIRNTLAVADVKPEAIDLEVVNQKQVEKENSVSSYFPGG